MGLFRNHNSYHMKKRILSLVILLFTFSASFAQIVTHTYAPISSVQVDGVGNYGYALPGVNFTTGDFTSGCKISDVDVTINWAKTDGSCTSPGGGCSFHEETSFRIDGPAGNEILAVPGTWSGCTTTSSVVTTFNQGSGIPSGTPTTGTFGPNGGNLNNFNGGSPFGSWNLAAGDNANLDPLCITWYSVTIGVNADLTPPAMSGPSNMNLVADPGQCGAIVNYATPTATDDCGATVSYVSGPLSGTLFPIGSSTVTYSATDPYGNSSSYSFTVFVSDNQAPDINCPADITAIAPTGSCTANVSFTTPTASDNCPGTVVAQAAGPASGSPFPLGNTTVAFTATDASGNVDYCTFVVTVVDVEDPVITCPSDINVVSTTGNCGAVITYPTPTATDNCPGVVTQLTNGFPSGSTFPSGTTTVTYLATDGTGNTASCSFNVTVDPVPNGSLSLAPSPVCQGDQTILTFNFTSGTPPYNVSITDGITVTNITGLSNGSTYAITPPTSVTYSFTAIQDATGCTRTSGFGGTASVVVTPIPIVTFSGLDSDYCESDSPVTLTGSQAGGTFTGTGITDLGGGSATFDPGTAGPTGPYDITYSFTDINGCSDFEIQQVSVDEQPIADAGSGGNECDLDFTFSAIPSVGVGTWTTVSGPGLPFFSNVNSATTLLQVSAAGTYVFRWTEVNGECSDFDEVTVNFYVVPTPNPGFGGSECDLDFQLGATPSIGTGTWSSTGPGNASFAPNANDPNAVVTVDAYGSYSFTWTEDNNGCTANASINVVFDQQAVADAGAGGDECDLNFTFSAAPSIGVGAWSATGPGSASFNAINSPVATVTVSNYGTYVFTWTETNGNCVAVDEVTVNFYEQPDADAGSGGDECDLDFVFSAVPSVGVGTWTAAGPGTASYSDPNDPNATATVSAYGTYVFTWTEVNGTCSDSRSALVNFYEQPVANAGAGGNECDLSFIFTGIASAGVGAWTYTGPGTAVFADDSDAATSVGVSAYGTYQFTWTEVNGTCSDSQTITVNFYEQPVAVTGLGGDECDLTFTAAATPSVGNGVWAQTSGPGSTTFNLATSPVCQMTVDAYGTYEYTWTETNGVCVDSRAITVNYYEQPVADAGSGGDECDLDFILSATPSVGTGVWTSSGPGTATFTDDTDPNATVTVSLAGVYVFTWTETNGTCTSADAVTVNLFEQPLADPGIGGDECDLNFVLNATPSFGIGTWTYSGPGGAFFSNANNAGATVTVDTYGTYTFTWTEVNGICSDNGSITVNFYEQPIADAGIGGAECDLDFELNGTASVGIGTWTYTGPGSATFSPNANDAAATVTVDATGSYSFTWTEDNNGCTDLEDITVIFNPLPVVSFTGLAATYCVDQTQPVPLVGTPSGGVFSGLGVTGNMFIPSVAGVGSIFVTYTYTDNNGCTNSETQITDVNGLPVVSYSGLGLEYCEDDASLYALTGSPSGGTFSGSGITGDDFIPIDAGPGLHSVTYSYSDQFGCTSTDEQDVTVNALPVVSFTGLAQSYCEDASNTNLVGAPVGGTFTGTGIVGNAFSPVSAGTGVHTITYTYTDGNGCTNSTTQTVTINPNPLPVISPSGTSEICDGSNIILNAGAGYSTYNWSNGQNGQTNTVTQAGTYNVTVTTAFGCTATSPSVQILVNQPPVVDLGNDTTICTGSTLTLDAGNSGADYSWSTFEITQTITVSTTNAYTVSVTDQNGCVGTDNIAVTVSNLLDPIIVASGPLTFCTGGSVDLDAGAGYDTYQWGTGESSQTITVNTPGVVELQVWDEFGCSGTDEVIVDVQQLPNAVITAGGSLSICEGDSVTLSASSNFATYEWNPGLETTSSITVSESGTYSVTVTDPNNNCEASSNSLTVVVNSVADPYIVASGVLEFCNGGSVSLSVEPGPYTSYLWTSGSTTPSIVVTETGDYAVTVIDANNCTDSTLLGTPIHVEVWDPQPTADQQGDSVLVTNGPFSAYQWYLNGVAISGATSPVYYPIESGNYVLEVWDENGCSGTSFNIEFTFTGIFDLSSMYDINVFPNPNNGQFTLDVEFGETTTATITLKDVLGKDIMTPEFVQSVSSLRRSFNISHLSQGVYHLHLSTERGVVVKRIIKR